MLIFTCTISSPNNSKRSQMMGNKSSDSNHPNLELGVQLYTFSEDFRPLSFFIYIQLTVQLRRVINKSNLKQSESQSDRVLRASHVPVEGIALGSRSWVPFLMVSTFPRASKGLSRGSSGWSCMLGEAFVFFRNEPTFSELCVS